MLLILLKVIAIVVLSFSIAIICFWLAKQLPSFFNLQWFHEAHAFLGNMAEEEKAKQNLLESKHLSLATLDETVSYDFLRVIGRIIARPRLLVKMLSSQSSATLRVLLAPAVWCVSIAVVSGIFYQYGFTLHALAYQVFFALCLVISLIDADHQIIPDIFVYPLLWIGLLISIDTQFVTPTEAITGAFMGYALLWVCGFLYSSLRKRQALGHGDMKMAAALGAWFGFQAVGMVLMAGCLVAGLFALIYFIISKKALRKFSFGPFLAIGGMIYLFCQPYLHMLLFRGLN